MSHLRDKYRHRAGRENAPISIFLQRTPSSLQQAKRMGFRRSVLLGLAAIFGHEKMTIFRTALGRAPPEGSEEIDGMSRQVSSTDAVRGRFSKRFEISSRGEVEF